MRNCSAHHNEVHAVLVFPRHQQRRQRGHPRLRDACHHVLLLNERRAPVPAHLVRMPLVHRLDRVQAAAALDRDDPPCAPLCDLSDDVERVAVM